MKAEKLNLNVSSTGAGILHPKLFSLSETALLIGSSFRKTFSCSTHLYHQGGKRQRKATTPGRVCWLCSLRLWDTEHLQQLLLFTVMTLHLHCDSIRTLGHN